MSDRVYIDPPNLNIDEIVETGAFYLEDEPNVWYVECKPAKEASNCVECGSSRIISYGTGEVRRIHDISIGVNSIDIMLKTQRYKCKTCKKVFRQPYEFVDENNWITNRLKTHIRKKSLDQSFKQVAKEFGITISTVS